MRQKLGVVSTLLTRAKLMIFDEPMSGLDPLARSLVKDLLLEAKTHDQTVVLCSHILSDLDEMCERIAIMHKGHLQFCGKSQILKSEMKSKTLEKAFLRYIQSLQENVEVTDALI